MTKSYHPWNADRADSWPLEAIRKRHGWPEDDEDGSPWTPEDHLDGLPGDYTAWVEEFGIVADRMEVAAFRAVYVRHGVPEIADLREQAPDEFERRCRGGCCPVARRGDAASEDRPPGALPK